VTSYRFCAITTPLTNALAVTAASIPLRIVFKRHSFLDGTYPTSWILRMATTMRDIALRSAVIT
jgi:hypothetical protein